MKDLKLNSLRDLQREGKSFYWSSFFLPKKYKEAAGILYSICRYFDDIADNDKNDKTTFLNNAIDKIKKDNLNEVNIFLKENNINISIFSDLIHGLIIDQKKITIKNKNDLINYSYHVAGTVGLMMSKVIGVKNKKAASSAIDLGIAMQLTNIARDVYEDARMNRIYLPSDWITGINLSILNGQKKINANEEQVISIAINKLIDLADKFYRNGYSGLKYIPFNTRLGIFIAANVYKGIGTKIKKSGNKYLKKRVYLNTFEKVCVTLKSISMFIFLPLISYKYLKLRDSLPNENL